MRSPLAYTASFRVPTRIRYGSEERVFDLKSGRAAELAKAARRDVETVVTPGNHESRVPASVRKSIEFFHGQMNAETLAVLKARSVAAFGSDGNRRTERKDQRLSAARRPRKRRRAAERDRKYDETS